MNNAKLEYLKRKAVEICENDFQRPDWANQEYNGEECWGTETQVSYRLPSGVVLVAEFWRDSKGVTTYEGHHIITRNRIMWIR